MSKADQILNFYEVLPKEFKSKKFVDKTYKSHLIKQKSMVLAVGGTGQGKTNMLCNFLKRSSGSYFDIIVFTGSNKAEPLYSYLSQSIQGLQLIDDITKMPRIESLKEDEKNELPKLIVWDDCIFLDKKLIREIEKFYMCSRKMGWTNFFLSQNYHSVSPFIRRNIQYLILFKITDMKDMKQILSKYTSDITIDKLKNMLNYATTEHLNFMTIAVNDPENTNIDIILQKY